MLLRKSILYNNNTFIYTETLSFNICKMTSSKTVLRIIFLIFILFKIHGDENVAVVLNILYILGQFPSAGDLNASLLR